MGGSNFVNPPYSRKLKEAFIMKALEESKKGKICVLLLPVSTSTLIFHNVILPNAVKIEFVKGRLKFEQKDEDGKFKSKGCGQHDSMIVVFGDFLKGVNKMTRAEAISYLHKYIKQANSEQLRNLICSIYSPRCSTNCPFRNGFSSECKKIE